MSTFLARHRREPTTESIRDLAERLGISLSAASRICTRQMVVSHARLRAVELGAAAVVFFGIGLAAACQI